MSYVPGVLTAGDLPDIAAAIAPASVRVEGLVDGVNRRASQRLVQAEWDELSRRNPSLSVSSEPTDEYIAWLAASLDRNK